jgi:hypothetical protein
VARCYKSFAIVLGEPKVLYDIFVSKLSSKKAKHQDDLHVLAQKLDKDRAKSRLLGDGKPFLEDAFLRPQIEANWRFIYQEPLYPESTAAEGQKAAPAAKTRTDGKKPKSARKRKKADDR